MRKYLEDKKTLCAVICNGCGRSLRVENGILKEGCYAGKQIFDYFSGMDGECHRFDLCEDCYQKMTGRFRVPVEKEILTELL